MKKNLFKVIQHEVADYKFLLRSVPSVVMALFAVSVILMNLLANKEIYTGVSWLALDCGLIVSWLSFLCMDMLTKRFGARASIKLSITASVINLVVCGILFVVSKIPGNWAEFYTYGDEIINSSLNSTIGGTWYILLGSTIAFIVAAIFNAAINAGIGKLAKKDNFATFALRSYVSTMIGQFLDNLVFSLIVSHVFFGWTLLQCVSCSITGCLVELICEIVFSPLGYRVSKTWEQLNVGKEYLDHQQEGN